MTVYHFSNHYYEVDTYIDPGFFGKVVLEDPTLQEFEHWMEEIRLKSEGNSVSRLNCLFTFPKQAEVDFPPDKLFLYELELTEENTISRHNFNIITFFVNLLNQNDMAAIKEHRSLMHAYWNKSGSELDDPSFPFGFREEILVAERLKIKKVIPWLPLNSETFLSANYSFYHITPTRNLESIFREGLKNRNGRGICVVHRNHNLIVQYIVEMMLIADGDTDFSIIEISPQLHDLATNEIGADNVVEATNAIHNYILRNKLDIKPDHVIGSYKASPYGIPDLQRFETEMKMKDLLSPILDSARKKTY